MGIVLRHQIEAAEQSIADIEKEIEGRVLSLVYELEALLQSLVSNARGLNEVVEKGQLSAKRGEPYFSENSVREIDDLYRRIESTFARAHALVKTIESFSGYTVEGKEKFYSAWSGLQGIVCFSLDRVMAASVQAERREGKKLGAFMNELFH